MQILNITGDMGRINHYSNSEQVSFHSELGSCLRLNSAEHEWKIEPYGVWWKKKDSPVNNCIPFNRITALETIESEE
jgi:hypothetical protein